MQINLNEIEIPRQELQDVVDRSMASIRKMHRKKRIWKSASRFGAAAASIAVIAGIFAANPALAENLPLIGHIFERVQDEQYYPGDYSSRGEQLTGTTVSESRGITVTLSEIMCSDESMNVSVIIESEEAFPESVLSMNESSNRDYGTHFYLDADQQISVSGQSLLDKQEGVEDVLDANGEFTDDHTFIGMFRINFNLYPFADIDIPDQFTWDLTVNSISYFSDSSGDSSSAGLTRLTDAGEWNFSSEVVKQDLETRTVQVDKALPNGGVISDIRITPYEVTINYSYDESRIQPGYEAYDSIYNVMLDGSGKVIEEKVGLFPAQGYDLSGITVYSLGAPDENTLAEIQEKIYDESFSAQLPGWLEENAVSKIEIPLGD